MQFLTLKAKRRGAFAVSAGVKLGGAELIVNRAAMDGVLQAEIVYAAARIRAKASSTVRVVTGRKVQAGSTEQTTNEALPHSTQEGEMVPASSSSGYVMISARVG